MSPSGRSLSVLFCNASHSTFISRKVLKAFAPFFVESYFGLRIVKSGTESYINEAISGLRFPALIFIEPLPGIHSLLLLFLGMFLLW